MTTFQHINLRPSAYLGMVDNQLSYNSFAMNALLALMDLLPTHNDKGVVFINMMADFLTIRIETSRSLLPHDTDLFQVFRPEFTAPIPFFQYISPIVWFSELGIIRFQSKNHQYDGIINNRLVAQWHQTEFTEQCEYFQIHFVPTKEIAIEKSLDREKILRFMREMTHRDIRFMREMTYRDLRGMLKITKSI